MAYSVPSGAKSAVLKRVPGSAARLQEIPPLVDV
jgi:hypothetical protein